MAVGPASAIPSWAGGAVLEEGGVQQTYSSVCVHIKPLVLMILADDNCEEVSPNLKTLAPGQYFHSHVHLTGSLAVTISGVFSQAQTLYQILHIRDEYT